MASPRCHLPLHPNRCGVCQGLFGSEIIRALSSAWHTPPNLMFITCPASDQIGKRIQDLHGVRVIMSHEEESFIDKFQSAYHSTSERDEPTPSRRPSLMDQLMAGRQSSPGLVV